MSERPQNKHLRPAKPGEVRNPKGRPRGSRNKLGEAFTRDLLKHWEQNGIEALDKALKENVAAYLRAVASVVPKEVGIDAGEGVTVSFTIGGQEPQGMGNVAQSEN